MFSACTFDWIIGGNLQQHAVVAVIEADDPVNWAVAGVIRSAGFAVEIFASAEQFIRSAVLTRIACLVLDVQVPGMNGLQLQSHLAAAGHHIPIIFIIGESADERSQALARELGAVNFRDRRSGEKILLKEVRSLLRVVDERTESVMRSKSPQK